MAVTSKGVTRGLTVLNGSDGGVNLPVNSEEIIKRQIALEEFVKNFVRVGGKGKLQRDGKIYYTILAKANLEREITVTADGSVVTGGMYGVESSDNFGYIKPSTIKAYEDFVELVGGKFMKELITKREQELENLPTLATDRIDTYQMGNAETIINDIKLAMVAAIGTTGKAATDAKWVPVIPRQIDKDYTINEAGGLDLYNDIDAAIGSLLNIGRMGSAEESYPFARGSDASEVTLGLSRNANRALTIAFKESPAGTFPGMMIDDKIGVVLSLFGTKTIILESMPSKEVNKPFNWILITTGKNGAIAMPSVFPLNFLIRPHFEGVSSLADIIEGVGGSWGMKFFQPELVFGSFAATAIVPIKNDEPNTESAGKIETFVLSDDETVISKKVLEETKKAIEKAKKTAKELKDLKAANEKFDKEAKKTAKELKDLKAANDKFDKKAKKTAKELKAANEEDKANEKVEANEEDNNESSQNDGSSNIN